MSRAFRASTVKIERKGIGCTSTLRNVGTTAAMRGCALRYQNGFDCQGLWVEVEVEKSMGLKTKREIREFGIEKFVRACKERVLTFAARQTEQSIRLGYWCDWDDPKVLIALRDALADGDRVVTVKLPSGMTETKRASEIIRKLGSAEYGGSYFTFSDENNYTIWSFLKKCQTMSAHFVPRVSRQHSEDRSQRHRPHVDTSRCGHHRRYACAQFFVRKLCLNKAQYVAQGARLQPARRYFQRLLCWLIQHDLHLAHPPDQIPH